ncbi:MAG: hypothetical protein JWM18_2321 [Chloroflexi bacterium]|nr:hypothetical protein [Chloroflexota bacterium]
MPGHSTSVEQGLEAVRALRSSRHTRGWSARRPVTRAVRPPGRRSRSPSRSGSGGWGGTIPTASASQLCPRRTQGRTSTALPSARAPRSVAGMVRAAVHHQQVTGPEVVAEPRDGGVRHRSPRPGRRRRGAPRHGGPGGAAGADHHRPHPRGAGLAAPAEGQHGSLPGEAQRQGAAEAPGCAGDECGLSVEGSHDDDGRRRAAPGASVRGRSRASVFRRMGCGARRPARRSRSR